MPERLAQVRFLLPFGLAVQTQSHFFFRVDAALVTISLHPREQERAIRYPDRATPPPPIDGKERWRAVASRGATGHWAREVILVDNQDSFAPDDTDRVAYTLAVVSFLVMLESEEPTPEELKRLEALASAHIRFFLGHYSEVSPELHVFIPRGDETHGVEIALARMFALSPRETSGHFRVVAVSRPQPPLGLAPDQLDNLTIDKLYERLGTGAPVPPHVELFLESRTLLHVQSNPRLALVTAQTAFEVFLQRRLASACLTKGVATLPLGKGRNCKQVPVAEALSAGNLRDDMLGTFCSALTTMHVKGSRQYDTWLDDTYTPRNEVVHGGRTAVTHGQAQAGIDAALAFAAYIDSAL